MSDQEQKKDCPCKAVVELAAIVEGQFNLTNYKLQEMSTSMGKYQQSFDELQLAIQECIKDLTEGAGMLKRGEKRFKVIEGAIREHASGENGQHAKQKKFNVAVSCGMLAFFIFLLITGHGAAAVEYGTTAVKVILKVL